MREIDALVAQRNFGSLLSLVEHGEEFVIVRNGAAVARLRPEDAKFDREAAQQAAKEIIETGRGVKLGGNLKSLIASR